ncbi:hypothetical protein CK203_031529 [Vitis vinifera]|uniref:Retrovirus-related Pol polyprotein from transposon TNT 1-94 n=1 Tax=Vitis vinifera TaxID=29760 RepID=A0A438IG01_VITVI|nr:hypothetical protein CK203_031529 [Vitis vinifera]
MEGETIKIMNQDLMRLDRFDGSNFTKWQDKVRFLLTALKIFYILDPTLAPLPEPKENDKPQVVAARKKREEDELICRGHILNTLSDRLYDLYTNTYSAREIWEALENKYKAEEEGTKNFLISQYIDFKFFDEKPLLPQIHELQVIVNKLKVLKIELPEAFQVGAIVAKLPSSWKGYQKRILHKSEDYSLEEIQKHLCIEEESRSRDKMVNAMLLHAKLNFNLWSEALLIACHILNRIPIKKNEISPYELWKGRKPNIAYESIQACQMMEELLGQVMEKLLEAQIHEEPSFGAP